MIVTTNNFFEIVKHEGCVCCGKLTASDKLVGIHCGGGGFLEFDPNDPHDADGTSDLGCQTFGSSCAKRWHKDPEWRSTIVEHEDAGWTQFAIRQSDGKFVKRGNRKMYFHRESEAQEWIDRQSN